MKKMPTMPCRGSRWPGQDWSARSGSHGAIAEHVQIQVLALVTEPMRILHTHFMKLGHAAPNPYRTPPVLDEIWEPTSIAYRVLSYFATMLRGHSNRLRIIWQAAGYDSFAAWQAGAEPAFRLLRRLILQAAAWVERRLFMNYFDGREAWPLFGLCDQRRLEKTRRDHPEVFSHINEKQKLYNKRR